MFTGSAVPCCISGVRTPILRFPQKRRTQVKGRMGCLRHPIYLFIMSFLCFVACTRKEGALVSGIVSDIDGKAVSNMPIQVKNVTNGAVFMTSSSAKGDYSFQNLPEG